MLNQALISAPAPPFHPNDTVGNALEILDDLKVNHWPVVDEGIFKGLIAEEILLDADGKVPLSALSFDFLPFSVPADEHFLSALRVMTERRLSIVAATTPENEYLGVITQEDLLQKLAAFSGAHTPGGMLVLEVSPIDFSPGEISRLIETNNAQIRQMNTQIDELTGFYRVVIRINRQEVSDIIATFQRYDYRVSYFEGEEQYENELRRNYHHLLHFLEM
jgi:acetoin utilization protein AcuB